MNQCKIEMLLRELTPEIRAYLFPGMTLAEPRLEDPMILYSAIPEPITMCDEVPEADCELDTAAVSEPIRRREWKPLLRKRILSSQTATEATGTESEAESLAPRTEQILAEIRRLQEKYDVTIDELEMILGYTVKLSPVHITRGGKIFLSDYEDQEVKMPNVAKALYFLYLHHPEGIRYKEVADHRDELLHIYEHISGRDVPEEMEKSISLLVNPYGNALNVNASRVKTAFRNIVSDRIARFYYISGGAGDVKKVPLDRDLVIWDY